MLHPLKELLFPTHCFSCNALGLEICSKCKRHWSPHLYVQKIEELTVYSSIRYSPVARSILLSAKENSVRIADELLISTLQNCLNRLPTSILRNAKLIPIPGSKRAIRKRGRDFILEITRELSRRTGIEQVNGLMINRRLLDQSGLSAGSETKSKSRIRLSRWRDSWSFDLGWRFGHNWFNLARSKKSPRNAKSKGESCDYRLCSTDP